jgi:hypothetical protein
VLSVMKIVIVMMKMRKKIMSNWNDNGQYGGMFVVCLKHDKGRIRLGIWAQDTEEAIERICNIERAPRSAILWVKKGK